MPTSRLAIQRRIRHTLVARGNGWMGRADGVFFTVTARNPVAVRVDLDR